MKLKAKSNFSTNKRTNLTFLLILDSKLSLLNTLVGNYSYSETVNISSYVSFLKLHIKHTQNSL